MENPASTANRIRHGRVSDRRLVEIKRLGVPPDDFVFEREEIRSEPEITRLAVLTEDLREPHVSLELLRNDHRRSLYLERVIEQPRRDSREIVGCNSLQKP